MSKEIIIITVAIELEVKKGKNGALSIEYDDSKFKKHVEGKIRRKLKIPDDKEVVATQPLSFPSSFKNK